MKLTIDTTAKTIRVEEPIKLAEFVKEIKKILPDWKEYELSYVESDLFVPYWPAWPGYPTYPIYADDSGTFNLEGCAHSLTTVALTSGDCTYKKDVPFTLTN